MVPVLILVAIAIPSFKLLYYMDQDPHADMTLKVTGHQWYWSYEYPDQGGFAFDSNMLDDETTKKARQAAAARGRQSGGGAGRHRGPRPGHRHRRDPQLVRAGDRRAGIRRRRPRQRGLDELDRPGTYYGQCNQICGINHPFMPIEIQAVSKDDFAKWVDGAKKQFGQNDDAGVARRIRRRRGAIGNSRGTTHGYRNERGPSRTRRRPRRSLPGLRRRAGSARPITRTSARSISSSRSSPG